MAVRADLSSGSLRGNAVKDPRTKYLLGNVQDGPDHGARDTGEDESAMGDSEMTTTPAKNGAQINPAAPSDAREDFGPDGGASQSPVIWRIVLTVLGGALGYVTFLVGVVFEDLALLPQAQWALGSALVGGVSMALVLGGPLPLRRAALFAVLAAAVAAVLGGLYGGRFAAQDSFQTSGFGALILAACLLIFAPFVMAGAPRGGMSENGGARWRDYARLFDLSWEMVVRAAAAVLFTGLFWVLLMVAGGLLETVGIRLGRLLRAYDWLGFVLSGLAFGLAMAVVHEMRGYITPYLFVRFARMMLPLVLMVTGLYVVAFPFSTAEQSTFGLSPVLSVLVMGAIAMTVISAAVDRDDAEATQSRFLRMATRIQAVILPALAVIALYAIWLRVAQYGWTPSRVMVALTCALAAGYAASYAGAVLLGFHSNWAAWLRRVNLYMALVAAAMLSLSLTPLLNAQAISARSQSARIVAAYSGATPQTPQTPQGALYDLKTGYGKAGRRALAGLEQYAEVQELAGLQEDIAQARSAKSRRAFVNGQFGEPTTAGALTELFQAMPIYPEAQGRPDHTGTNVPLGTLNHWLRSCRARFEDGPACAMLMLDAQAYAGRQFAILLIRRPAQVITLEINEEGTVMQNGATLRATSAGETGVKIADLIAAARDGDLRLDTPSGPSVFMGGLEINPRLSRGLRPRLFE